MSKTVVHWSHTEKEVAQSALRAAYERETTALMQRIREQAASIVQLEDAWHLHDFLSARRHEVDGKYSASEDSLMFTLSRLVKEGWIAFSELEGLEDDKRAKVRVLTLM